MFKERPSGTSRPMHVGFGWGIASFLAWIVVLILGLLGASETVRAVAGLVTLTVVLLAHFTTAFERLFADR